MDRLAVLMHATCWAEPSSTQLVKHRHWLAGVVCARWLGALREPLLAALGSGGSSREPQRSDTAHAAPDLGIRGPWFCVLETSVPPFTEEQVGFFCLVGLGVSEVHSLVDLVECTGPGSDWTGLDSGASTLTITQPFIC